MCEAGEVKVGDVVLEIGPGRGALTKELLARGARVVAVEKDRQLLPVLEMDFEKEIKEGKLRLIVGDALEMDVGKLFATPHSTPLTPTLSLEKERGQLQNPADLKILSHSRERMPDRAGEGGDGLEIPSPFKLIANIPYYITGALLEHFLSAQVQPSILVFLVQKEVAERIARSKKESLLSLSVKVYGEPKYIKTVPAGAFSPPPTVDSAILAVRNVSRAHFKNATHEARFFQLLRAGFSHKRKLLAGNLKPILGPEAEASLMKAGIPPKARAEDVSLEQWLVLAV